jgi:preprotein translocase subunit SecD
VWYRRRGLILFVVGLLLVTIPLSLTAYQNIMSATENSKATTEVQNWLQGTSYKVDTVSVNNGVVVVTVEGTGQLKPLQQLANQLARTLGQRVLVNLRMVPAQMGESRSP